MSTSTDAKLWFGLCDGESDEDLPESVRAKLRETYKHDDDEDEEEPYHLAQYADELLEPLGCVLVYHQSDECTRYGLAVSDSKLTAWRGYPKPINEALSKSAPDWEDRLRKAAKLIGWPYVEPQWWMASYWG